MPKKARAKKTNTVAKLARQVQAITRAIEVKTSYSSGTLFFTQSGDAQNICTVPSGNGDSFRIGTKILVRRIEVRWSTYYLGPQPDLPNQDFRLLVVQDKQSNKENYGGGYGNVLLLEGSFATLGYISPYENNYVPLRNKVLMDKRKLIFQDGYIDGQWSGTWTKNVNIPVQYDETNAGSAVHILKNNLFLMAIGSALNTAVNRYCEYTVRLDYTDA